MVRGKASLSLVSGTWAHSLRGRTLIQLLLLLLLLLLLWGVVRVVQVVRQPTMHNVELDARRKV
jgi:hypothetical protein